MSTAQAEKFVQELFTDQRLQTTMDEHGVRSAAEEAGFEVDKDEFVEALEEITLEEFSGSQIESKESEFKFGGMTSPCRTLIRGCV